MLTRDRTCLLGILDAVGKVEQYTEPFDTADALYASAVTFDAVLMNFIVIGEMAERLSAELKQGHASVDWRGVKALRNIIAHDYFGVDAEEVWQIIKTKLPELKRQLIETLDTGETGAQGGSATPR
jgi:uncharacterized protein with HEPN domain